MEKERKIRIISVAALIITIICLTVAFAALSQRLTINGAATLDAASWGIKFENLSDGEITGDATINDTAVIADDLVTINNIDVSLSTPGDSVTYTVDLVNEGTINAEIYSIETPNLTEEQERYLNFNVTYDDGEEVKQGDILNQGERKNITIKIEFDKDITDTDLPSETQNIDLSYKLNFVQTDKTQNAGDNDNPEVAELKVGDYVDYISSGNVITYWHADESGYASMGISRDIGTNQGGWRVLKIDGDKITLISATASNPNGRLVAGEDSIGRLLLKGQQLYNNGVEILNRLCDTLYTKEGVGKARSINLEDINELVGYEEPATSYHKITSSNLLYYPVRYVDDNGSAVDTDTIKTNGFSRSEAGVNASNDYAVSWNLLTANVDKSITGYGIGVVKANTSLGVTDNSYSYNISDYTNEDVIKELILGSTGSDKGNYPRNTYWIASRVVHFNSSDSNAWFTMAYCNPSATNNITYDNYPYTNTNYGAIIINEDGTDNRNEVKYNQKTHFIRPIIELDTGVTIDTTITDETDGTYTKPWKIVSK